MTDLTTIAPFIKLICFFWIHVLLNLTNDAWNFIRFPSTIARYVKIYGSSGESKVLSFEEIKVLKETDSQLVTSHGHENISTTSTTTGLDGS